jgi:hypothetical protein
MKWKSAKTRALLLGAAVLFAFPVSQTVHAGPVIGRVTAHSDYGNGSATGAVRKSRYGYEVQLPSGFWEDCEGNCREALRRQHLDFWETINEEGPGVRR